MNIKYLLNHYIKPSDVCKIADYDLEYRQKELEFEPIDIIKNPKSFHDDGSYLLVDKDGITHPMMWVLGTNPSTKELDLRGVTIGCFAFNYTEDNTNYWTTCLADVCRALYEWDNHRTDNYENVLEKFVTDRQDLSFVGRYIGCGKVYDGNKYNYTSKELLKRIGGLTE